MIEFHDREREIEEIKRILSAPPNLIIFVYGPINSGKTALFQHLIERLPNDFVTFYVNLRERMIRDYNDFVEALFEIPEGKKRVVVKELVSEVTRFVGIPISKSLLDLIFREDKPKNAFRYIVKVTEEIKNRGKKPVLIIDELQKIGDVKVDDYLIYELFNLFVRLTKELHCCHVFAVTSDSLFVEKVYNKAMLHGRCRYLLVDDFDYDITVSFLKKHGFKREEIKLVWDYFGGKPVYLVEAVNNRHRLEEFCEKQLKLRYSQMLDTIYEIEENRELFNKIVELLKTISEKEIIKYAKIDESLKFCVRKNVLFLEPVERIVKPQSRLDLLAIRKVLQELG